MNKNINLHNAREKKTDALFGVLHLKDKPYLHQRTAQHMFGETDTAIVVPTAIMDSQAIAPIGLARKIIAGCMLGVVGVGVLACLIELIRINPHFVFPFLP